MFALSSDNNSNIVISRSIYFISIHYEKNIYDGIVKSKHTIMYYFSPLIWSFYDFDNILDYCACMITAIVQFLQIAINIWYHEWKVPRHLKYPLSLDTNERSLDNIKYVELDIAKAYSLGVGIIPCNIHCSPLVQFRVSSVASLSNAPQCCRCSSIVKWDHRPMEAILYTIIIAKVEEIPLAFWTRY